MGEVDCKTAKLQNCKTAKLQNCKTARLVNRRTAEPQNRRTTSPQSPVPSPYFNLYKKMPRIHIDRMAHAS